jgi:hypothetical protein
MFKTEVEILSDMIKSTIDNDKALPLVTKITNIKNLSHTMSGLIKNIVTELDESREQVFRILETIAVIEMNKDPKKFQEHQRKQNQAAH